MTTFIDYLLGGISGGVIIALMALAIAAFLSRALPPIAKHEIASPR